MASPNIAFDNIPPTIRKPGSYTEFNSSLAVRSLPINTPKLAIIAQKIAAGTATADVPIQVFSEQDAIDYGGQGSQAHLCCKAALAANPNVTLFLVPIDDAVGTLATGEIVVTGIASSTGNFDIWIGNVNINIPVTDGDAVNDIAAAIDTAINAKEHLTPVVASVVTDTVTLTANNDGLLGNNVPVSSKNTGVGTTALTIAQPGDTIAGATDPSIATALTNLLTADYNLIYVANNDATNLGLLATHLAARSAPTEGKPAVGVFGYTGVQATLETLTGTTLNYERITAAYLKYSKTTENPHSLDYEVGAAYASIIAKETDPAKPLNQQILSGIAPPDLSQRLSRTQQESLLLNGATPLEVFPGEQIGIVRAITTYTTNAAGILDIAYLDLTTVRTLDFVKLAIETRQSNVFGRSKLNDRVVLAVRSQALDVLFLLEGLEIVEKVAENAALLIVERDSSDPNRVNLAIPSDVVNGLHVLANRIDLFL